MRGFVAILRKPRLCRLVQLHYFCSGPISVDPICPKPNIVMKVDSGKLRHFCDDPVCPDPIWKPVNQEDNTYARTSFAQV